MSWTYRRSTRLPGGFRLNYSKRGFGWSWGFRGFRIGRDSSGRLVRTVSVPGTGLYNREYLSTRTPQNQGYRSETSYGGCIGAALVVVGVGVLGNALANGNTSSIMLILVITLGVYFAWRFVWRLLTNPVIASQPQNEAFGREPSYVQEPEASGTISAVPPRTSNDQLGMASADKQLKKLLFDPHIISALQESITVAVIAKETKKLVESLEPSIKEELRNIRRASDARFLIEHDIRAVIIRAGCSNGAISEHAARVYLSLFRCLHAKKFARWNTRDALDVLQSTMEKDRDSYCGSPRKPFTLTTLERLDANNGTALTKPTRDLMLMIGAYAASVDGKVSDEKAAEIRRLKEVFDAVE